MKIPFNEFSSKQQITTLKNDLKDTRNSLRENISVSHSKKTNPKGIELVENALKAASAFHHTKKNLESQISTLKQKLDQRSGETPSENSQRLKFNEGAYWMSTYIFIFYIYNNLSSQSSCQ